jgi:hypothetical protein
MGDTPTVEQVDRMRANPDPAAATERRDPHE